MKFRIKHNQLYGFCPQVKYSFFSAWYTIREYSNGYVTYGEYQNHLSVNTFDIAYAICAGFKEWECKRTTNTYFPLDTLNEC